MRSTGLSRRSPADPWRATFAYARPVRLALTAAALLFVACGPRDDHVFAGRPGAAASNCEFANYLAQRRALNFCDNDGDCVEIEPAPCLAPYYANRATASASLNATEDALALRCDLASTCSRHVLGPPRCRRHRCVTTGLTRKQRQRCWSDRQRVIELGRPAVLFTLADHLPGRHDPQYAVLRVDEPAVAQIRVDAGACAPYELALERPPSSWSRGYPARTSQEVSVDLEPGDHRISARSSNNSCPLTLTVTLQRRDGTPITARYHGLSYWLNCE